MIINEILAPKCALLRNYGIDGQWLREEVHILGVGDYFLLGG